MKHDKNIEIDLVEQKYIFYKDLPLGCLCDAFVMPL